MIGELIEVGSKKYYIKFTVNILCQMTAAGIDPLSLNDNEISLVFLRDLFYYGLQKFHKKEITTTEKAGDLMSEYLEEGNSFSDLSEVLIGSLMKSLGVSQEVVNQTMEQAKEQGKQK